MYSDCQATLGVVGGLIKYLQYHDPHHNTCKFYADKNVYDAEP